MRISKGYQLTGSERQAAADELGFDILRRQQNLPDMIQTLDELHRINPAQSALRVDRPTGRRDASPGKLK